MADMHGGGPAPDLVAFIVGKVTMALGGVAGAFVAHLLPPAKPWRERLLEYIGGAFLALYAGPVAGPVLYGALMAVCDVWHIRIAQTYSLESVTGLAGFLAGALGLNLLRGMIIIIRRRAQEPRSPG